MHASHPSAGRGGPRGFTLVELMVVLVVLAVVVATVAPALRVPERPQARAAAESLAAVYAEAALAAHRRRATVTTALDTRTGRYVVLAAPLAAAAETVRVGVVPGGTAVRAGDGMRWTRTTIDPFGRARGPSVTFADAEEAYDVVLDPWTARARVLPR